MDGLENIPWTDYEFGRETPVNFTHNQDIEFTFQGANPLSPIEMELHPRMDHADLIVTVIGKDRKIARWTREDIPFDWTKFHFLMTPRQAKQAGENFRVRIEIVNTRLNRLQRIQLRIKRRVKRLAQVWQ